MNELYQRDYQEAVSDLHEINSCYQDIELVLASNDLSDEGKLLEIGRLNNLIGQITKKWI